LLVWVIASVQLLSPHLKGAAVDPIVEHRARALQPGEVVRFRVISDTPLENVVAKAFQKVFPCSPSNTPDSWEGLLGLDLELKPGTYTVQVEGQVAGRPFRVAHPLQVRAKQFPTRRLTVEEKYASPPPEVQKRIQREADLVAGIFGRTEATRYWTGPFVRCVPGEAISSFGRRSVFNGQPRSPHSGTDFRGALGTPIKAPNNGRVVLAQELYFAGNTVIIDHGQGLYSYLAHLSKIQVKAGDPVEKGDPVGLVGATGRVTGPHLHWSLRLVGTRVDPVSLMEITAER